MSKSTPEPLHDTKEDAVRWVLKNTEDELFVTPVSHIVIRICSGVPQILTKDEDGVHFWASAKAMTPIH